MCTFSWPDRANASLWSLLSGGDISESPSVGIDSGLVFSRAGVRRLETQELNLTNAKWYILVLPSLLMNIINLNYFFFLLLLLTPVLSIFISISIPRRATMPPRRRRFFWNSPSTAESTGLCCKSFASRPAWQPTECIISCCPLRPCLRLQDCDGSSRAISQLIAAMSGW